MTAAQPIIENILEISSLQSSHVDIPHHNSFASSQDTPHLPHQLLFGNGCSGGMPAGPWDQMLILHNLNSQHPKVCEYIKRMEEVSAHENLEALKFSSWVKFGFNEVDFGWGNPIWSGIFGEVGSNSFQNVTFFKEIGGAIYDNAVEAWVTLDEKIMSVLEHDPQFLALASPNPSIIV